MGHDPNDQGQGNNHPPSTHVELLTFTQEQKHKDVNSIIWGQVLSRLGV